MWGLRTQGTICELKAMGSTCKLCVVVINHVDECRLNIINGLCGIGYIILNIVVLILLRVVLYLMLSMFWIVYVLSFILGTL